MDVECAGFVEFLSVVSLKVTPTVSVSFISQATDLLLNNIICLFSIEISSLNFIPT